VSIGVRNSRSGKEGLQTERCLLNRRLREEGKKKDHKFKQKEGTTPRRPPWGANRGGKKERKARRVYQRKEKKKKGTGWDGEKLAAARKRKVKG